MGRDVWYDGTDSGFIEISTHTPRVGRDVGTAQRFDRIAISTHTPRVGRDKFIAQPLRFIFISTHTPRVGRDL